jgi:hypothetical protein
MIQYCGRKEIHGLEACDIIKVDTHECSHGLVNIYPGPALSSMPASKVGWSRRQDHQHRSIFAFEIKYLDASVVIEEQSCASKQICSSAFPHVPSPSTRGRLCHPMFVKLACELLKPEENKRTVTFLEHLLNDHHHDIF